MGKIVRQIREFLHWSVAHLERESGVSRNIIYNMEKKGSGKIEAYEKVFEAMGYELEVVKKDDWSYVGQNRR